MNDTEKKSTSVSEEQNQYRTILRTHSTLGFILLIITFLVYLSGVLAPHIPHHELPEYWSLPLKHYIAKAELGHGWSWIALVQKGDIINLIPIAFLAAVTIISYIGVIPVFIRKKDWTFVIIAVVEVAVLLLAASGLLRVGH